MTVAYDGTNFAGFQIQPGRRTVQATLETAIARVTGVATRIEGAGRTDAGVHATGQVVSFRTASCHEPAVLRRAVNAILPEDVAVVSAVEVEAGFHARFSAKGRGYRYTIWNAPTPAVLNRRYVYHWRAVLDVDAMDRAAQLLVGRHDFAAFGGTTHGYERPTSTVRTLFRLHCWRDAQCVVVDAAADAFLPRMVRNLVGTLLRVGMGQVRPPDVEAMLRGGDRRLAGVTAPSLGLCLTRVWYD